MNSRLCDENCNECGILRSPNYRQLTKTFEELVNRFGRDEVYPIVQRNCPNFTACADCHIDDLCHVEGCKIIASLEEPERDTVDKDKQAIIKMFKEPIEEVERAWIEALIALDIPTCSYESFSAMTTLKEKIYALKLRLPTVQEKP